jgi:hypothetical protein
MAYPELSNYEFIKHRRKKDLSMSLSLNFEMLGEMFVPSRLYI